MSMNANTDTKLPLGATLRRAVGGLAGVFALAGTALLAGALLPGTASLHAQDQQGAYIAETVDEDGDQIILMETDWISMRMMPALGSTVTTFVFRPTQNEIIDITQPKNLKSGGGLLQDNVWEQDWRFQELRGKWYDYQITKTGPDEVQVVFETTLVGWIGAADSGVISKLLSDLKIRRTVTLKQGTPYFLFDVEFINDGEFAKLPLYWAHNASRIDITAPDHAFRPSALGINETPSTYGEEFVYNFNHGWSARVSPTRKEGVVYLMDYDYLSFLYNNNKFSPYTTEWVYDNLLILKNRPVKTRIYVLPTMGLERVDHATEYFIAQLQPTRADGDLRLTYKLTSSYEKARKITLVPTVVYDLISPEPKEKVVGSLELTDLGIEPQIAEATFSEPAPDPVVIRTKAFIDLADGTQVVREWETFHVGTYGLGHNIRKDLTTPVYALNRPRQDPFIPTPDEAMEVNRKDFNIFALMGANSRVLKLEAALATIPKAQIQTGYHPGFIVPRNGLTDFPYDYERLFNFRALVFNNSVFDVARHVGMSILVNYLERGGGLVYGGGENVFGNTKVDGEHPIYRYIPLTNGIIRKGEAQLNSPATDHPIFQGVDLSSLPWAYYTQRAELTPEAAPHAKVLMKVGDYPFIVEYAPKEGQRIMMVLALPYGDPAEHPGKPPIFDWAEWPKLYANIVRYAAHDL